MSDHFKLLQLPTQPLQRHIPLELEMAREIERDNVTAELLKARFEEAGYEAKLEEDGAIYLPGTWLNLRMILYPDHSSLVIRAQLTLNTELSDEELQKISWDANHKSYLVRYVTHRWDDGEVGLFGNYVLYYTFGLNMPNLIFSLRKFVDTFKAFYEENKADERMFPKVE